MKTQPSVFIVDDNKAVCEALCCLFQLYLETPTVAYQEATLFLEEYDPTWCGCIVLDMLMPKFTGLEIMEELALKGNKMPIIILTGYSNIPMVVQAIKTGAKDYLIKPFNSLQLVEKTQTILADYTKKQTELQTYLARFHSLTSREREIMKYITEGKLNKQIAVELGIALKTVEIHRFNIMKKLKAKNLAELVHIDSLLKNI